MMEKIVNKPKRTALITGGGAGMGEAISRRFAGDGMAVGVLDINVEAASAVAQSIIESGGKALALAANVADRAQVEAAIAKLRGSFGPITVLVNNAGIEGFTPFAEIGTDDWDRIMKVNVSGTYFVTQTVLADMVAAGWGRIINFTSFGAQIGAANMVHYTASKGAIMAMTRSLAIELGPKGITVNSIAPGLILTPMSQRAIDGKLFAVPHEQIVASFPIPRIGHPDDAAAACAFFASEEAGYITAQLLGVNGGATV